MWLIPDILFLLIISAVILFSYIYDSFYKKTLMAINRELKLDISKGRLLQSPSLYGNIDDKSVTISKKRINQINYLEVRIVYEDAVKGYFSIKKEPFFSGVIKAAGIDDLKIYDSEFDSKMRIDAESGMYPAALLNKEVRKAILSLSDFVSKIAISGIDITLLIKCGLFSFEVNDAVKVIKSAIAVSNNISGKKTVKERLIDNINNDDNLTVRLKGTSKYLLGIYKI